MDKTGEICSLSGHYKFAGHTDPSLKCHPTSNEMFIPMMFGARFPPVKSCEQGAYWQYHRPL